MSNRLRIVLAGCGGITRAWMPATLESEDAEIVGLADLRTEAIDRVMEMHGLADVITGTDIAEVLDRCKPDIVYNCTTPDAHVDVALEAFDRGCHVLSEKPLASSTEEARRAIDAAEKARKVYAVIQNRRYDPNIRALRRFLDGGAIGRITTVNADFYKGVHFGGFRDHMKHVLLEDMAIHSFDQCRLISGADPISVYCKEWNPAGSWYDFDASAMAIFDMTDGIVFNYRGSWCSEGLNTSWQCQWRIVGEKGTVTWDGEDGLEAQTVAGSDGKNSTLKDHSIPTDGISPDKIGSHGGIIREFLRCVRTGETPETTARDNLKSLAMVDGAVQSAGNNSVVSIAT